MEISKASMQELHPILVMYQKARKELQDNDIHQWDQHDPSQQMIYNDIAAGNLYVAKEGEKILGSIVLNEEKEEPKHEDVDWIVPEHPTLYLHRLVVHPDYQGEGTGNELMHFAEDYAKKHGYTSIRLEAYEENEVAHHLYQKFGFKKAGEAYYPRREVPFVCYEKPLV